MLLTIFALSCAFGKTLSATPDSFNLLILYTGNALGELKPCGCSKEEDQGGIERRGSYLKETRQGTKNILLVDTGDSFKEPSIQGKFKGQTLMQSMSHWNYDAVVIGEKDLIYGNRFLSGEKHIPWLATNLELEGSENIPGYRIKNFDNGLKVAMLALADPELFYAGTHGGLRVKDPDETLKKLLLEIRRSEQPNLVVLLTHMPREKALKFLDVDAVDVVINGHIENDTAEIDMTPVKKPGKIFVQPSPKGQKVGELWVSINPQGEKTFEQQMVKLDSHVKLDPEMVKLYNEYNEQIERLFFASLASKRNDKKKVYAGETTCKQCHAEAHSTWSQSRHGKAYNTLEKVNKAFDPECLVCHTTGFNRPGGFISEIDTPELTNVQCEVCHGPGREHMKSPQPGWSNDAAHACKQCHVKNHSPRFQFADYWSKIKH